MRRPTEKPGVPLSTRKSERSEDFSPVRAYTSTTSPCSVSLTHPLVIHILLPVMMKSSPSSVAVVESPRTSVPAPGSDIHIDPMISPLQARGKYFMHCSGVPFTARLLTKSSECAKYDKQKPGSAAASSSWIMADAVAS